MSLPLQYVQKIQQITILKNTDVHVSEFVQVQKIQQITILKNAMAIGRVKDAFKKYNKLQSLRTKVCNELGCAGSKNTTNYNP